MNAAQVSRAHDARLDPALLLAFVLLTVLLYSPGLHGGFVLDDVSFLIDNAAIHVSTARFADWLRAAESFPAAHQGRWLTMTTFAANYYFAGLDPFWFKATNLVIHIVNGVLVWFVVRALLDLWTQGCPKVAGRAHSRTIRIASVIAGAWLVLPINLSAVLYASQRLESLATLFVLLGLWLYLRARLRRYTAGGGATSLWIVLIACTAVGVLAKESAVLLPLFAFGIELTITRMRDANGRLDRGIAGIYVVLLAIPLALGTIWLVSWLGGADAYDRPFTTGERLFTEARVLVRYIEWTLVPLPSTLSFYNDDVTVSHGWLDPPTTLPSIVALAALAAVAIVQRRSRPLFALGIFWFFAAHVLTATVIPLELAFEHRNYFASLGLLLSAASLIALEPGLSSHALRLAVSTGAIALFAIVTGLRAAEWSTPLGFATAEAAKRPHSPRAQYDLADAMIAANASGGDSVVTAATFERLKIASELPFSGITPDERMIVYASVIGRPIEPAWWRTLIAKLQGTPPTESDIYSLRALLTCQVEGFCASDTQALLDAFSAALSHPHARPPLLGAYAEFAAVELHDNALAEKALRDAIASAPNQAIYRANLVRLLLSDHRIDGAERELDALTMLNRFGTLDTMLADLRREVAEAKANDADAATPAQGSS